MRIRRYLKKIVGLIKQKTLKIRFPQISIGKGSIIDYNTLVRIGKNKVSIGENVYLRSNQKGYHVGMPFPTSLLIDKIGGFIEIGDNCRINGCYIHAQKEISIGANTVIAAGSNILDSNGHETLSKNRTIGRDTPQPIRIGTNVWIGVNSVILKGTTIGDNSIISAGSVVKGDFPSNSFIQGNPGRIVKTLNIF